MDEQPPSLFIVGNKNITGHILNNVGNTYNMLGGAAHDRTLFLDSFDV